MAHDVGIKHVFVVISYCACSPVTYTWHTLHALCAYARWARGRHGLLSRCDISAVVAPKVKVDWRAQQLAWTTHHICCLCRAGSRETRWCAKSIVITVDHVQCYVSFVSMLCCVDVPQFQVPTATVHIDFAVTSDDCPHHGVQHIRGSSTPTNQQHLCWSKLFVIERAPALCRQPLGSA